MKFPVPVDETRYGLHDSSRRYITLLVKHLHEEHNMTPKQIADWFHCPVWDVKSELIEIAKER